MHAKLRISVCKWSPCMPMLLHVYIHTSMYSYEIHNKQTDDTHQSLSSIY